MNSIVVPKARILRRFRFWVAVPSGECPGSVDIRPERADADHTNLTSEERESLYEVVVPEIMEMMREALGPCVGYERWVDGVYRLRPLTPEEGEFSDEVLRHLFDALLQAAA